LKRISINSMSPLSVLLAGLLVLVLLAVADVAEAKKNGDGHSNTTPAGAGNSHSLQLVAMVDCRDC
jgi:hypothetical protein